MVPLPFPWFDHFKYPETDGKRVILVNGSHMLGYGGVSTVVNVSHMFENSSPQFPSGFTHIEEGAGTCGQIDHPASFAVGKGSRSVFDTCNRINKAVGFEDKFTCFAGTTSEISFDLPFQPGPTSHWGYVVAMYQEVSHVPSSPKCQGWSFTDSVGYKWVSF